MKQMMSMMRDMTAMMSAQSGMMTSHVEGRIAALKSELKITDAQALQWSRFADALRGTAKSMDVKHEAVAIFLPGFELLTCDGSPRAVAGAGAMSCRRR